MRQIIILFTLVAFMVLMNSACGGDGSTQSAGSDQSKAVKATPSGQSSRTSGQQPAGQKTRQHVRDYKPIVTPDNPTVDSTLKVKVNLTTEEQSLYTVEYVFWVDVAIVKRGNEDSLQLKSFKKGSYVYVDVIFKKAGDELFRRRSDMIQILNSSPKIVSVDFPRIEGPGTYEIPVIAEDPDGDLLSYALEGANIPSELSINPESGVISFTVLSKPPAKLDFTVVVRDDSQGEFKQKLSITLQQSPGTANTTP